MMELRPSEVKQIILDEHAMLRGRLDGIEALLARQAKGENVTAPLTEAVHGFFDVFLKHIGREEGLLVPMLEEVDVWGTPRIAALHEEHRAQRALIEALRALKADDPQFSVRVTAFAADIRKDMAEEETDCLSDRVLRDDIVVVDTFIG